MEKMRVFEKIRYCFEQDFNEDRYWKRRNYVQTASGGYLCAIRLILLRRTEAKKCATTGLSYKGQCCQIDSPLILYHGLNGIVIAPNVHIGKNVTMGQHVTIAKEDVNKTTYIEDNVTIGAGAVILNNVHVGTNAKIGANSVVTHNVPAGATVAGVPAKIIN